MAISFNRYINLKARRKPSGFLLAFFLDFITFHDMNSIKSDFPIFANNPEMIYLDSASTLQKPQTVIDAVSQYLGHDCANIHRGNYTLSHRSEEIYESARSTVGRFI